MELFKLLGTIAISGVDKANSDINATRDNGQKMAASFNNAANEVAGFGIKLATTVQAASTAIGTLAVKSAAAFETSFAKVSTLIDTATVDVNEYQKDILKVSSEMNVSTDELCESIYQAISASVDQADAIDFTTQAMKLAKGGFTDTATAVDILTTAINAYGLSSDEAQSLSDKLITTQNKGKTTVAELASAMGKVIPTAKTFGVSIDELCGYYATMTSRGIATAETTTYLNGMLNELGKAGTNANKALMESTETLKEGGMTYQECVDSGMSVVDMLALMDKSAKDNGKTMMDLFGSSEAAKAASVLVQNIDTVKTNIDAMGKSAGATEEAYSKMEGTATASFKSIKNQLANMFTELGKKLMPTVEKLMKNLEKSLPKIQKLIDKLAPTIEKALNKLEPVLNWLLEDALPLAVDLLEFCIDNFEGLAIAIGLTVAALKTMSIVKTVTTAIQGASTAMGVFNAVMEANPIGMVIGAVGGLVAAIGGLISIFDNEIVKEDERLTKFREEQEARQANIDKINEEIAAIDAKAQSNLTEVANTERLWKELQTLCDEEGNVSDADKARADFILNELNDALGTEYKMTGNQIDNYNELTNSVHKAIEAKKAEILLSAQEEKYKKYILELSAAEQEAYNLKKELSESKIELDKAEAQWNEAQLKGKQLGYEADWQAAKDKFEKEKALYAEKKSAYETSEAQLKSYYDGISLYENASALVLEGNTEKAIELLDEKNQAFKTAAQVAEETAAEQKRTLETQKNDAEGYYKYLKDLYDKGTDDQKKALKSRLDEAEEYAKKASEEYEKAGSDVVESYTVGIDLKKMPLMNKVTNLIESAMNKAKEASDGTSVGEYMVEGINSGVLNKLPGLQSIMRSLIQQGISAAQDEAKINSPSRVFADKVGAFIPSGVAMGVEEHEDEAIEPIENMIDNMAFTGNDSANIIPNNSVSSSGISLSVNTSSIIDKLNQLIDAVMKNGSQKMYLNGDVLVGELAPAMDSALGTISMASMRGQ